MHYFITEDENKREVRGCTFTFLCSRTWDGLRKTSDPKIRHCSDCQKKVYMAETEEELLSIAKGNGCAAVLGVDYSTVGMPIEPEVFYQKSEQK